MPHLRRLAPLALLLLLAPAAAQTAGAPADEQADLLGPAEWMERGGAYQYVVRLWNHGAAERTVHLGVTSSDRAALDLPGLPEDSTRVRTLVVAPGKQAFAGFLVTAPRDAPLGPQRLQFHVEWENVSSTILPIDVTVAPARYGMSFRVLDERVAYVIPDGGNLTMEVRNDDSVPHEYRIDHEIDDAQMHLKELGASATLGPGETATHDVPIRFAGLNVANGTHALNVSLGVRDRPVTARNESHVVPVDFSPRVMPQRLELTVAPSRATVLAGHEAMYEVTLVERAGSRTRVHLDANATEPGLLAPQTRLENMAFALEPLETRTIELRATARGPGEHAISIRATSEDTGALLATEEAVLVVEPAALELVTFADTVTAAANSTATLRIDVANAGERTLDVEVIAGPGVRVAVTSLRLAPDERVVLDASVDVGADATPGSILQRSLVLRAGVDHDVALRVRVADPLLPPAPATPRVSALEEAGQLAGHPAALASMGLAAASLGVVFVARREGLVYAALTGALPLYTRLSRPALLADERRGEVHALVVARPGIHLTGLRDATGLTLGALVHHLRILEKHGLLASQRDGKLRRFYAAGAGAAARAPQPTVMQEQVLGLLAAGPLTRPEIGERLGLSQQGVSYHVKNLERSGRVFVRREGGVARVHRVTDVVVAIERTAPGPSRRPPGSP